MMKQSYYDWVLDDLKSANKTFADKFPSGLANYFCIKLENNQWKPCVISAPEIFSWARQLGLPIPEGASEGQESDTRIVCRLLEDRGVVAKGSLYLTARDNQLFLSACAKAEAYEENGAFPFRGLFEEAKKVVRHYLSFLVNTQMNVDIWRTGETLDESVTRMSAYFDNIRYCYKDQDLRYIALDSAWFGLKDRDWTISDIAILGFCSKNDPVLKQWIEDHPDFSYDKLYEYAIRNRDAYEAKHGRRPENLRFHESFGAGLKNMKRTFG